MKRYNGNRWVKRPFGPGKYFCWWLAIVYMVRYPDKKERAQRIIGILDNKLPWFRHEQIRRFGDCTNHGLANMINTKLDKYEDMKYGDGYLSSRWGYVGQLIRDSNLESLSLKQVDDWCGKFEREEISRKAFSYLVQTQGMLKIGCTTDLRERMKAYPKSKLHIATNWRSFQQSRVHEGHILSELQTMKIKPNQGQEYFSLAYQTSIIDLFQSTIQLTLSVPPRNPFQKETPWSKQNMIDSKK